MLHRAEEAAEKAKNNVSETKDAVNKKADETKHRVEEEATLAKN